jgi:hypothetical protein
VIGFGLGERRLQFPLDGVATGSLGFGLAEFTQGGGILRLADEIVVGLQQPLDLVGLGNEAARPRRIVPEAGFRGTGFQFVQFFAPVLDVKETSAFR